MLFLMKVVSLEVDGKSYKLGLDTCDKTGKNTFRGFLKVTCDSAEQIAQYRLGDLVDVRLLQPVMADEATEPTVSLPDLSAEEGVPA